MILTFILWSHRHEGNPLGNILKFTIDQEERSRSENVLSQACVKHYLDRIMETQLSYLIYSVLVRVLPLQEVASARVLHLSLSFGILVQTAPCCPTMSSLQSGFGLPTDLTPFICHSVLPYHTNFSELK